VSALSRSSVPRSQSTDKRYYGVVEGIVMEVMDPEKEGRIKIRIPRFDEETIFEYCPVRQFYAGNGYGAFFVPEAGDHVLVAFVQGDMRLPIVLGGLYSEKDKPPSDRQKDKDQKMIRTKAGHELLFDDSEQERRIRITTAAKHVLDLDDKDKKALIKTTGGHQLVLDDAAGTITVKTSGGQSMVLDGHSGTVTITGATIVLEGSTVKVGGQAAAMTPMLAEMFLPLFSAHIHMLGQIPTTPPVPAPPITPPLTGSATIKLTP